MSSEGFGEDDVGSGSSVPPFPQQESQLGCKGSFAKKAHVCGLFPCTLGSAHSWVAEPLSLRTDTVKQLSPRVTPEKAHESQAIFPVESHSSNEGPATC